jgi:VIT1/CCC1 family predicted Fe2+/Mn2+ transporter
MLTEELKLNFDIVGSPLKSAFRMFGAFLVGGILPIIPYFFASGYIPLAVAIGTSLSASFAIGAMKSKIANMSMLRGGLEMAGLGTGIAMIGYGIGSELASLGVIKP